MAKFQLLKDWVDLHVPETRCFSPSPCALEILTATHHPAYVEGFQTGTLDQKAIREIGLPWSEGLRDRTLLALVDRFKLVSWLASLDWQVISLVAPITRIMTGDLGFVSITIWRCLRGIW